MDDHNGVYEGKRVSRSQLFDKESASETSEFDDVYEMKKAKKKNLSLLKAWTPLKRKKSQD